MGDHRRVRLDVSYDGTDFSGWAAQPARRTVAGVLIEALERLVGADDAARPDRGRAHRRRGARDRQVCHIDLPATPGSTWGSLLRRLAALMPPDARVRA
jgi:tRNA pseudouridine38-40 synthase